MTILPSAALYSSRVATAALRPGVASATPKAYKHAYSFIEQQGAVPSPLRSEDVLASDAFYFLDQLMAKWQKDPSSVHPSWCKYFENLHSGKQSSVALDDALNSTTTAVFASDAARTTARTIAMVRAFEKLGHFRAKIDPLDLPKTVPFISRGRHAALRSLGNFKFEDFGFSKEDYDKVVDINLPNYAGFIGKWDTADLDLSEQLSKFMAVLPRDEAQKPKTVGAIYERLKEVYTGPIGVEFLHVHDRAKINWLRNQLETPTKYQYTKEMKLRILDRTIQAVQFEQFAGKKFATLKRFGLDGCEAAIVALKCMSEVASLMGVESVLLAMAHRGRLSTLTNVMNKPAKQVFAEFIGNVGFGGQDWGNSGDVKYHMGVEYEYVDEHTGKHVMMSMPPNPSHLEAVDGVLLGNAYARQVMKNDENGRRVLPLMIHGDASAAGQGIMYEAVQMSDLPGYSVGGSIHIVINNQIGFTTNPVDAGSGNYCTDLAKAVAAPIFHVNADDPEAVSHAMEIALKYRQKFGSDVFFDIVGYRRFGHNELDMPNFTQPILYEKIKNQRNVMEIYGQKLIDEGVLTKEEFQARREAHIATLEKAYGEAKTWKPMSRLRPFSPQWDGMATPSETCAPRLTGVTEETLVSLGKEISRLPSSVAVHPTIGKVYKAREECFTKNQPLDFGTAEALAFATLLREGTRVRVAGQDCERGTFSHRHAVINDQKDGRKYFPLKELAKNRHFNATIDIHNSLLSEYAALGFEYGYSLENPNWLNIWEAQFGDFANGAQIVIDQFVASGESKWNQYSGLVMLLPHGYDGQGPEHSSCRIERFLTLSDDREDVIHPEFWDVSNRSVIQRHNLQVCNVTTASNFFHLLRRQIHRGFRKPLVVATPKKLLRLREACSPLSEFTAGTRFARYIFDPSFAPHTSPKVGDIGQGCGPDPTKTSELKSREGVERLVLCSGQVYYDLIKARAQAKLDDKVLISRVEQLSPFPLDQVVNELMSLPNLKSMVWCQEEPMNQGAWPYASRRLKSVLRHCGNPNGVGEPIYCGRDVLATTAGGDHHIHQTEQAKLLQDALDLSRTTNSYIEKYTACSAPAH